MSNLLLTISGHDRPGIVCDVAEVLLELGVNIEDSSMTALRGRFTMMLIVRLPEGCGVGEVKAALAELEQRTRLSVQSQLLSDEEVAAVAPEPDHVITVHGADRAGIVFAVSEVLAEMGVSIVDLSTQSRDGDDGAVYMMVLEVAAGSQQAAMRSALREVAEKMDVEIDLHALDQAVL